MSELMRLILGIVATFGLLVLIMFIMSCIVVVCDNKEKKRESRPGKIFAREMGRVITSQSVAPTVELQNEWGKWVISEIRCPNCLEYFDTDCYSTGELNKCPNCGAKLKGGAES